MTPAPHQGGTVDLLPVDRDAANKAFDIAFRGDTDGIDDAMAALFAAHRTDPTTAAQTLRDTNLISKEQYDSICQYNKIRANVTAKVGFGGEAS